MQDFFIALHGLAGVEFNEFLYLINKTKWYEQTAFKDANERRRNEIKKAIENYNECQKIAGNRLRQNRTESNHEEEAMES
jgi:hypothetical protein